MLVVLGKELLLGLGLKQHRGWQHGLRWKRRLGLGLGLELELELRKRGQLELELALV